MHKHDQITLKSAAEAQRGRLADLDSEWKMPAGGPFDLSDSRSYESWKAKKLAGFPKHPEDYLVRIGDMATPTDTEIDSITRLCGRANMAVYETDSEDIDSDSIRKFAAHFGLSRLDRHLLTDETGISALEVAAAGKRQSYIPYSSHRLGWHTDGYYNDPAKLVRAMVLHCIRPAASGGENALLDHEIAYINLRDENPAFIAALMHPQCMKIPANKDEEGELRPARSGPVFSVEPKSGALHMRFTARKRNIEWRQDSATQAAIAFLSDLMEDETGPAIRHRLTAGQGLISNNILHNRTAFEDDPEAPRLIYRARYLDRIADT